MSEKALVPIEQKTVIFYEDELTAVLVDADGDEQVYIPIRPIVEKLGLAFGSQRNRINRDPVLSVETRIVFITNTNPSGGNPNVLCLPLKFLPGFLFGISADRVRPELREKVILYQRECYDVLAEAFLGRQETAEPSPSAIVLMQIREMTTAITRAVDELIAVEQRTSVVENRLEVAARVVGNINKRLTAVERRLAPGESLTKEQSAKIQELVRRIADEMSRHAPGKSHHAEVYRALSLQTQRAKYEDIPQETYELALRFLDDWLMALLKPDQD